MARRMTEAMRQLPWAWGHAVPRRDPLRTGGHQMPYAMYVCLQDEDKIVAFTMDATTGQLTPHATVTVAGGPSVLALSPRCRASRSTPPPVGSRPRGRSRRPTRPRFWLP